MGLLTLNLWAQLMGPDFEADNKTSNTVWKEDGVHLSSSLYGKLSAEISNAVGDQINKPGAAPRAARRHHAEASSYRRGDPPWKRLAKSE